jgi:hypothetical protein
LIVFNRPRARTAYLTEHREELDPGWKRGIDLISSFGEDANGELFIVDFADGKVYPILPL